MGRVTNVSATGSTCTGSVGVMSVMLTQVTGLESVVVESAGMGCTNEVGVELLGTGFANTMRTGLTGSGSTGTAPVHAVRTGSTVTGLAGAGSVGTGPVGPGTESAGAV